MSAWYEDAVIYELHVRAYQDSNGDGIGDFAGLTQRLDHLVDLGVTAIWLLPFYPSPLRDDGYDIADYRTVNPSYGDLRSFKRFLRAAHDRELKVITELVINHTSDQHPWFKRARRAPAGSTERDFYVWSDTTDRYPDARIIFSDFEHSNWAWDPVAGAYYWHRFYSHQPDLNFDNPAVEEAVLDVLDHWLSMGVDGLRLDAVPYLYEREGTNCENLPETHAFLKRLRAHIDEHYQGRMLLAEANQWPEDAAAYFGDGDECHMNFHFPVMPRLFMGLQMENSAPIVDILDQTPTPPEDCQWATFLRNHDELTLEMVTDEERDYMVRAYAHDPQMRINLGIRRRLAPLVENDRRRIELLNALLFSLPGTPVLYYGDEIGMGDNVYLGDRDGVRTPMQWSPDRNAGFSRANPHRLYLPLITEPGFHYENVNVEAQNANRTSILRWMKQLIALRRRHPVLSRGDIEFLEPDNPHVLAFVRTLDGEAPVLVVANLSRLAQHVELDLRSRINHVPVEVFGQTRFSQIGEHPYQLTLGPYGFFWFSLEASAELETGADELPMLADVDWTALDRRRSRPLATALRPWLVTQRWFGAKGRTVREVVVDDVIPLPGGHDVDVALLLVSVAFTEGDDHLYAVPVARVSGAAASLETLRPSGVIARREHGGLLVDAMVHQPAAAAVIEASLTRRRPRGRHGQLAGRPRRRGLAELVQDPLDLHLLGVEQSNSSVIVRHDVIVKLVRRLEPGPHPDIEVPRHLREHGFDHVPDVVASLDYEPSSGSAMTLVVAHEAVVNEGDLWQWMTDQLTRMLDLQDPSGSDPVDADLADPTFEVVELLGARTAQLHDAMVGEDQLAPIPFTLLHQRSILQTLRSSWREARRELRRYRERAHPSRGGNDLDAVVEAGDSLFEAFDVLRTRKLAAQRIRLHGDLHLGQVLWSGHDVVFIDFEGEPARPLSERTIKRSPLVDVAGLMRSIDYAARVAVHTEVERGRLSPHDAERAEAWALSWRDEAQRRLVASYRAGLTSPGLVPTDDDDFSLLLDAVTVEKALYEIRYELANRPDWVGWPVAAVRERVTRGERR